MSSLQPSLKPPSRSIRGRGIGDSAGGNLTLACVRYCVESRLPEFPPPGRMLVSSPCGDISMSRDGPDSSLYLNRDTDIFISVPGEKFGVHMRDYFSALSRIPRPNPTHTYHRSRHTLSTHPERIEDTLILMWSREVLNVFMMMQRLWCRSWRRTEWR